MSRTAETEPLLRNANSDEEREEDDAAVTAAAAATRKRKVLLAIAAVLGVLLIALGVSILVVELLKRGKTHGDDGKHHRTGIHWKPCQSGDKKFLCGTLSVPLDHAIPDGERIDIGMKKLPVAQGSKRLGSMLIDPGGPGGSGIELVEGAGEGISMIIGGTYDIIGFDPRGVGLSQPIRCFEDANFHRAFDSTFPTSVETIVAREQLRGLLCAKNAGKILPYMSTAAVARDMKMIMLAEGDEELNYWGYSYGSILGQTFVNMFPELVGRVIIDGVVNPYAWAEGWGFWLNPKTKQLDWLTHAAEGVAGFASLCEEAGAKRCALATSGNVAKRIQAISTKLALEPIPAVDAEVPGVVDDATLRHLLFRMIYQPAKWPVLAEALDQADRRNATLLQDLYASPPEDRCPLYDQPLLEPLLGISCSDGPVPPPFNKGELKHDIAKVNEQYPYGGDFSALARIGCSFWPGVAKERFSGPWNATTKNPVLILSNAFDPVTPLESARIAHASLAGSRLVVKTNAYGHCSPSMPSKCTNKIIRAYFADGTVPEHDVTNCTSDASPFAAPAHSSLFARGMSDVEEPDMTIHDALTDIWQKVMMKA
ncbi:hypothetical protein HDU87_005424 [Geranomyces variabilis]|uniref:Uncharacterized protein n=1 Tax=Geranomyces variabilis TaxID=109894 RepID=A0AAD5XLS9_9FUNG|nr:hypothetical protein HDU87_005424 [Geranomyces variabilis]